LQQFARLPYDPVTMSAAQPAWRHSELFPIIARIIGEEYQRHGRFVVAHEIAARLLQDGEARAFIDSAHQQQPDWSPEQTASNMVAWFSQRFTIGESDYVRAFDRTRVDGQYAYKPQMKQRDKKRELYRLHNGDEARVVQEYADAEQLGEVERENNSHNLTPQDYAARLFADGARKGWIRD
jgi:hypothetical protein